MLATWLLGHAYGEGFANPMPSQMLADALETFAKITGYQLVYRTEIAAGLKTKGAEAGLSAEDTLRQLLRGTGLAFAFVNDRTIAIYRASDRKPYSGGEGARDVQPDSPAPDIDDNGSGSVAGNVNGTGEKSVIHRGLLSRIAGVLSLIGASIASGADVPQSGSGDAAMNGRLDEIIVTAQKKSERMQDVPIPVTVLSADSLADNNQVRIADYYMQVPGLSLSPGIQSSQLLVIRGITTGGQNTSSTVGVTVDDVPFGGTGGQVVPDFDPSDLARVEVLRGPQGTLYGASSMGGLIKFVTVDPSTDGVSGNMQAGTSSIYNGAQLGYTFRGSINLPISDNLALRASAYTRQDPGYIDNPVLGIRGVNFNRTNGGRLSALWRLTDTWSLKMSALYQDVKGDGTNDLNNGAGNLQQTYIPGVGQYEREAQAYNAVLTGKIGGISVVAVSGYNVFAVHDSFDDTLGFGPLTQSQFGVSGTPAFDNGVTHKFTQEVRLSTPIGSMLDAMLGAFYTHEYNPYSQTLLATDPSTGAVVGEPGYFNFPSNYREYAVFGNLTYHATDRFDIQVGARDSQIAQSSNLLVIGPDAGLFGSLTSSFVQPTLSAREHAFTYLLTPSFKISPDLMVYARLASGYRPGGANQPLPGVPPIFDPDKTINYEIGAKGDVIDHLLSFDVSVYYIDWKDIQLFAINSLGYSYTSNAGDAKSQGVELSLEVRPIENLKVGAWVAFADAELTNYPPEALAAGVYAVNGDQLPYSSRFSGAVSIDDDFPIAAKWAGFVGATVAYVGHRQDVFTDSPQREYLPAYAKTDLRAGMKHDSWTVNLYANNAANRRGVISGGLGNFDNAFYFIQPRTVGLNVSKHF